MFDSIFEEPKLRQIAPDILHTPFLTKGYVEYLIEILKQDNSWKQNASDKYYATRDIYLQKSFPVVYAILNDHLDINIWPLVEDWWQVDPFSAFSIFAIEYTLDSQRKLKAHHDTGFISASVKLNNDYTGAELVFPRQNFTNVNVEVGDLIIWPSQITHLHKCTELTSGEKYSLTIWTKEDGL